MIVHSLLELNEVLNIFFGEKNRLSATEKGEGGGRGEIILFYIIATSFIYLQVRDIITPQAYDMADSIVLQSSLHFTDDGVEGKVVALFS